MVNTNKVTKYKAKARNIGVGQNFIGDFPLDAARKNRTHFFRSTPLYDKHFKWVHIKEKQDIRKELYDT